MRSSQQIIHPWFLKVFTLLTIGTMAHTAETGGSCPDSMGKKACPNPQPMGVRPWHVAYGDNDPRLHTQINGEDVTIFDISTPLHAATPCWDKADGLGPELRVVAQRMDDGDGCNESRLKCSVHTGTHVDAPGHFVNEAFREGRGAESLNLYVLNGPAHVVEVRSEANITAADLARASIPEGTQRLLLKTKNTEWDLLSKTAFECGYVGLMLEAAQWLLDHTTVRLVGIDYLSIGPWGEPHQTLSHQALLHKGIIVLEGVVLTKVAAGLYNMHCLPLKLVGSEGSPTRCILIK